MFEVEDKVKGCEIWSTHLDCVWLENYQIPLTLEITKHSLLILSH